MSPTYWLLLAGSSQDTQTKICFQGNLLPLHMVYHLRDTRLCLEGRDVEVQKVSNSNKDSKNDSEFGTYLFAAKRRHNKCNAKYFLISSRKFHIQFAIKCIVFLVFLVWLCLQKLLLQTIEKLFLCFSSHTFLPLLPNFCLLCLEQM